MKFAAFVTNLSKYTMGDLVGEWVTFPATPRKISAVLDRLGPGEIFITDYDISIYGVSDKLSEYENLDELNYLAHVLDDLDGYDELVYESALGICDYADDIQGLINLTFNLENYCLLGDVHDEEDLGMYWIEESGCYGSDDLSDFAKRYFDYEAFGSDVAMEENGDFTDNGYIYETDTSWYEEYDGTHEDIPEEYLVMETIPEIDEEELEGLL